MSIDVMTKIIQRCPVTGSPRLALLVMANWCDDDGESLYPSIELIAEAMQVSRSQAQRVLHGLMPAGDDEAERAAAKARGDWWVCVVGNEGGGAPGATRRYQLNVARLDELPKLPAFVKADQRRRNRAETGRMGATGRTGATPNEGDGSHGCDPTGRMGATRLVRTTIRKIERECAREDEEGFELARRAWPTGFTDSRDEAWEAWSSLSSDDRAECVVEIDRFVNTTRSVGRKHFCSLATYLREQRWKALPERPIPITAPATRASAPKRQPTAFMRANPHLYPEIFGETQGAEP